MLEAGWNQFEQEFFALRVEIQGKELEQLNIRSSGLTVAASVLAGFSFTALVEFDIAKSDVKVLDQLGYSWLEPIYYGSIGFTIAFNLYIIVIATMSSLRAQQLALHGNVDASILRAELPQNLGYTPGMIGERAPSDEPRRAPSGPPQLTRMQTASRLSNDDVKRAIDALRAVQPSLLCAFGGGLCTFVSGAIAMVWIKTTPQHYDETGELNNSVAILLTLVFVALLFVLVAAFFWVNELFKIKKFHDAVIRTHSNEERHQAGLSEAFLSPAERAREAGGQRA